MIFLSHLGGSDKAQISRQEIHTFLFCLKMSEIVSHLPLKALFLFLSVVIFIGRRRP